MRPFLAASSALGAVLAAVVSATAIGIGGSPDPLPSGETERAGPQAFAGERAAADLYPNGVAGPHSFYFTRAIYTGGTGFAGWKSWRTDFPKADLQFLVVLRRLARLDAYHLDNAVRLDDPNLRRFPFLYAVEVGYMRLTDTEVRGLREYLLAGGFLVVDDFWGSYEWRNFEATMRRVLPEYRIVDLPLDHEIFHTYYDIEELVQVPNVGQGVAGGRTSEQDGYEPYVRGIFDEQGRLMVVINWNTDLGDAWEWAEHPQYPLRFSTYAYQMGVNFIVYAMSH